MFNIYDPIPYLPRGPARLTYRLLGWACTNHKGTAMPKLLLSGLLALTIGFAGCDAAGPDASGPDITANSSVNQVQGPSTLDVGCTYTFYVVGAGNGVFSTDSGGTVVSITQGTYTPGSPTGTPSIDRGIAFAVSPGTDEIEWTGTGTVVLPKSVTVVGSDPPVC